MIYYITEWPNHESALKQAETFAFYWGKEFKPVTQVYYDAIESVWVAHCKRNRIPYLEGIAQ